MPRSLSVDQIESVKDRINFDRRLIAHFFSSEILSDGDIVEELVASTRAEVNPNLVKWIQQDKVPHELIVGSGFGGGGLLNPRQDILSLMDELWTECMNLESERRKLDKKKRKKAIIQGKRTVIAAIQKDTFIVQHAKKDRNKR